MVDGEDTLATLSLQGSGLAVVVPAVAPVQLLLMSAGSELQLGVVRGASVLKNFLL